MADETHQLVRDTEVLSVICAELVTNSVFLENRTRDGLTINLPYAIFPWKYR